MKFIGFNQTDSLQRRAAIVGDVIDLRPVTANDSPWPTLSVATTTQPAGSTVTWTAGVATALTQPGYHLFTVTCGGQPTLLEAIAFPAAALNVPALQFLELSTTNPRPDSDRRNILSSIASACTPAAAQAALEAGAAVSPNYGLTNTLVPNLRLSNYGATQGR